MLEALEEGNNEAEWLVDLTTQADRQGRCCRFPCAKPLPYAVHQTPFRAAADVVGVAHYIMACFDVLGALSSDAPNAAATPSPSALAAE